MNIFLEGNPALFDPLPHAFLRFRKFAHIIGYDEARHAGSFEDQVEIIFRARRHVTLLIAGDTTADRNAGMHGQMSQRIVEDLAADIVIKDIDRLRAMFLQLRPNIVILIINRHVIADIVGQPLALFLTARDPNDAATRDLGNLTDHGTGCTGRARHDNRITRLRAAMFQQSEIGGHPGSPQGSQIGGQQLIIRHLVQFTARHMRIILPAQHAHGLVTNGKSGMTRFDHGANAGTAHHFANFSRRNIAADILHPAFLCWIKAQYLVFHQYMAFGAFRHFGDDFLEIIIHQPAPLGASIDQPLPVVGHKYSPLEDLNAC